MKKLSKELIIEDDLIDIEDHPDEIYLAPYTSATRITGDPLFISDSNIVLRTRDLVVHVAFRPEIVN